MIYDTKFKVKYYEIEQELMLKLIATNNEAGAQHDIDYSYDDIQAVCEKLYRDEFASVFYAENILDDKIDNGIKIVLDKMKENSQFADILKEIEHIFYEECGGDGELVDIDGDITKKELFFENIKLYVFYLFFSKQFFHLTHKCVFQQFSDGTIDNYNLDILKNGIIESLKDKR